MEENFKVAILSENLQQARGISSHLRRLDLLASVFSKVEDFLFSFEESCCDLLIVHLGSIRQMDLLKQHSSYRNRRIKIVFFYGQDSIYLLPKLQGLSYYGLLREGAALKSQLEAIFSVLRREAKQENLLVELKGNLRKESQRNLSLERENLQARETLKLHERKETVLAKVLTLVNENQSGHDFLQQWEECRSYSLLHLDKKEGWVRSVGKPLVKSKKLPPLQVSSAYSQSERFLQMLQEAYSSHFAGEVRAIELSANTNLILMIECSKQVLSPANWAWFHPILKMTPFAQEIVEDGDHVSATEDVTKLLQKLSFKDESESSIKYLRIDISSIGRFCYENRQNKFRWQDFLTDFVIKLKNQEDQVVYQSGLQSLFLGVEVKELKNFHQEIKQKIAAFTYWDYFADTEIFIHQKYYPSIELAPSIPSLIVAQGLGLSPLASPSGQLQI